MQPIGRRPVVAVALLLVLAPWRSAVAASSSKEERARRIHRRRDDDRWQQDLTIREQGRIEGQRSRPVAPTVPGSQVVPNR